MQVTPAQTMLICTLQAPQFCPSPQQFHPFRVKHLLLFCCCWWLSAILTYSRIETVLTHSAHTSFVLLWGLRACHMRILH